MHPLHPLAEQYLHDYLRAALDIQGGTPVTDALMQLLPDPEADDFLHKLMGIANFGPTLVAAHIRGDDQGPVPIDTIDTDTDGLAILADPDGALDNDPALAAAARSVVQAANGDTRAAFDVIAAMFEAALDGPGGAWEAQALMAVLIGHHLCMLATLLDPTPDETETPT